MATVLLEAVTSWESSINKLHSFIKQYDESTSNLVASLRTQAYRNGIEGNIFGVVESVFERIDNRLADLTGIEERLEQIRVDLNRCRNSSKTLSPISQIPPEILAHIVTLGQEEDEEMARKNKKSLDTVWYPTIATTTPGVYRIPEGVDPEDPEYKIHVYRLSRPPHFPTLFSHVCRDWRNVVISTATFWRKICTFSGMERANEYISRSKGCPLEIATKILMGSYGEPSAWQTSSEFTVIQDNASRVGSLDMSAPHPGDVVLTLDELAKASPLPPMHCLKLNGMEFRSLTCLTPSSPDLQYEDLLAGIQSLDLDNMFFPWHSVAYTGLKELRLSGVQRASVHDTFAVLTASPLLESLTLEDSLMPEPTVGFPGPILLKKLHTLKLSNSMITNEQGPSFNGLLSSLHTPNLINLSMSQLDGCGSSIEDFVKRLSSSDSHTETKVQESKVQFLSLQFFRDMDEDMLIRLLSIMPNVVDLNMCGMVGMTHPVLSSLSVCDEGCVVPRLLPKLKALRITWCNAISSSEIVKDVIQSRLDANAKSENGVKIERLVLIQCGINRTDIGETRSWLSQNVRYFIYTQEPPLHMLPFPENEIEMEGNGSVDEEL
ncbi:hypothetical protein FRC02_008372 [Tulasnella sp. 418]|nr:hypothetical protein FRC02_008372 [Tulasnella sp. 418]